ncbi:MAG: methylmalonyl-CoA mutase family protein [Bacteroidota bacterium]
MSQNSLNLSELFPYPSYEEWKAAAVEALKGAPFEKKMITNTYEGIELQPIYSKSDVEELDNLLHNFPGEKPYLRHTEPLGFKITPWEIAQEINIPLPNVFNEALINALERGQTRVVLKFNENFAINTLSSVSGKDLLVADYKDFQNAVKDVQFECASLKIKPNSLGLELAALIIAYIEKNKFDKSKINLSFGISPLAQLKNYGKSIVSISKLIDDAEQLIRWKIANKINAKVITIDGETYLNGGSSSVQDVAFSLAEATFIIRELIQRGLSIDEIAQSIEFDFAIGPKFFTEIAKFRAARILWAKIVEAFGGNEESQKMYIHASTSKINKTIFDPNVNMLRVTTEALSAVLGGCQSICVGAYDEAIGIPGDFSLRIARNVQNILFHETHLIDTIDPASGSWYLEVLTNQIANKVWELFREIEKKGGILESLKTGFIQGEIRKTAESRKANIASRRDTLLGTNKYPNLKEKPVSSLLDIPQSEIDKHLKKYAEKCTNPACEAATNEYRKTIYNERNKSLEKAIAAFNECTTIGQLIEATGALNSDDIQVEPISPYRMGTIFEELRQASAQADPQLIKICLVNFGLLKEYKIRNDFSSDFFQVAGLDIVNTDGAMNPDEAIDQVKSTDYKVYVICSTDERYAEFVEDFARKFKQIKPNAKLILAGYPTELVENFRSAGVDDFIHIKTNIYEFLSALMKEIGILN